jgi:hypothetical protein
VIGIVGACMFLFRFLVHCWLPYKETEFVDLCSVANISVFILNEKLHGYYVHGKSIYGKADLNLWQLYQNLDSEGQNLQKERGISNEDQQDFEMYISVQMREIYEGLFLIQNETLFGQNQKKDEDEETTDSKEAAFNPYKEAKKTGKSVEEVRAAQAKKEAREAKKKARKKKDDAQAQEKKIENCAEYLNNVYHVHAPAPTNKADRSVEAMKADRKKTKGGKGKK